MRNALLAFCLFVPTIAEAMDECTQPSPSPLVESSSKLIGDYRAEREGDRKLEEHFTLDKTQRVIVGQYGCTHSGTFFTFSLAQSPASPGHVLGKTSELATRLEAVLGKERMTPLKNALKIAGEDSSWLPGDPIETREGEEWVTLDVSISPNGDDQIEISIDNGL